MHTLSPPGPPSPTVNLSDTFQVGKSALPLRSVIFCATVTALIGLINIGSTAAFNAIVSLTIAGLFLSYLFPILLMIRKRVKGEHVRMGPWTLGKFGLPCNIIAACFLVISTLFSFFPPALPVTLVTMNWSCVVFGGVVIIGLVYYVLLGRNVYHGPIIEKPILLTDQTPTPEVEVEDKS
jgi:choline transport protein